MLLEPLKVKGKDITKSETVKRKNYYNKTTIQITFFRNRIVILMCSYFNCLCDI